jgi:membrane associated rhomboid family serine protease
VGSIQRYRGVLGAYALLFQRSLSLVFFIFIRVSDPTLLLLGVWFLMQLLSAPASQGAGVAFFAHIGGFLSGMLLMAGFIRRKRAS